MKADDILLSIVFVPWIGFVIWFIVETVKGIINVGKDNEDE